MHLNERNPYLFVLASVHSVHSHLDTWLQVIMESNGKCFWLSVYMQRMYCMYCTWPWKMEIQQMDFKGAKKSTLSTKEKMRTGPAQSNWIWIHAVRTSEYNHQRAKSKNPPDSKKVNYVSASLLNWDSLNKDSGWKSEVTFCHFIFSSISWNTKNPQNSVTVHLTNVTC